jgi:hypothetical protein
VPTNQHAFEWERGGMTHIAAAIKKWFGQVDVIVANVGIWALEELVPTMWESQSHYMTGPLDKVLDELRMLMPLSKQVCTRCCCPEFRSSFQHSVLLLFQTPIWATSTRTLTPVGPRKMIQSLSREDLLGTGYEGAKQLGWRISTGVALQSPSQLKQKHLVTPEMPS